MTELIRLERPSFDTCELVITGTYPKLFLVSVRA